MGEQLKFYMPIKDLEKRKESNRKASLKYYEKNKEKVLANTRKRNERIRKEYEDFKSSLKCERCEENHIACLEFHHLNPLEKDKPISTMFSYSKERFEAEVKKCIVLCSNCHKKLHWDENH